MKKILILFAVILFGVAASSAQTNYIVNVQWTWDPEVCTCESALVGDYFKIILSIYDDVNEEWVVQNREITTPNATYSNAYVDVPEVEDYCKEPEETPSFTIYASVYLIDEDTNPETECCSKSHDNDGYSCHDFNNGIIPFPVGTLE